MLARVKDLCTQAYRDGFTAGFQSGFEKGVAVALGESPTPHLTVSRSRIPNA